MGKWIKAVSGGRSCIFLQLVLFSLLLSSCAIPVRQLYKVDDSLPIGSIQGDSRGLSLGIDARLFGEYSGTFSARYAF